MKILLVQEKDYDRNVYVDHLTEGGHQVDCFLPKESLFEKEGIPFFRYPQELANLVRSYDAVMLDRETFRDTDIRHCYCWVNKYIQAIVDSGYQGKVIIESSCLAYDVLLAELGSNYNKVEILRQPFSLKDLDGTLETKVKK